MDARQCSAPGQNGILRRFWGFFFWPDTSHWAENRSLGLCHCTGGAGPPKPGPEGGGVRPSHLPLHRTLGMASIKVLISVNPLYFPGDSYSLITDTFRMPLSSSPHLLPFAAKQDLYSRTRCVCNHENPPNYFPLPITPPSLSEHHPCLPTTSRFLPSFLIVIFAGF